MHRTCSKRHGHLQTPLLYRALKTNTAVGVSPQIAQPCNPSPPIQSVEETRSCRITQLKKMSKSPLKKPSKYFSRSSTNQLIWLCKPHGPFIDAETDAHEIGSGRRNLIPICHASPPPKPKGNKSAHILI